MDNLAEKIKEQMPIERLCERMGIEWKRKNDREGFALCPFHQEKTGSFHVTFDKGLYHCFGCGTGGDVITLWEEFKGLQPGEGLLDLASELGIHVEKTSYKPLKSPNRSKSKAREADDFSRIAANPSLKGRCDHILDSPHPWLVHWASERRFSWRAIKELAGRGILGWNRSLQFYYANGEAKTRVKLDDSGSCRWSKGAVLGGIVWNQARLHDPCVTNVVILEGETDLIGLMSTYRENDQTVYVAAPGASWVPTPDLAYLIGAHRNVYICGDFDGAGMQFNQRVNDALLDACGRDVKTHWLDWGVVRELKGRDALLPPKADIDWLRNNIIVGPKLWECFSPVK